LRKYKVRLTKGKDVYYVAQCIELPAAITQGKTKKEALKNIKEAIALALEDIEEEVKEKKARVVEVEA